MKKYLSQIFWFKCSSVIVPLGMNIENPFNSPISNCESGFSSISASVAKYCLIAWMGADNGLVVVKLGSS